MKRISIVIITVVIIIIAILLSKYYKYIDKQKEIDTFNVSYEQYLDIKISGTDIATIINQAVNDNEKAFVKKDKEGKYIQNDTDSINIEIKVTDLEEDTICDMNTLYNGGMANFVKYYSNILFKCTSIEYNSKKRVKYMLFEQI